MLGAALGLFDYPGQTADRPVAKASGQDFVFLKDLPTSSWKQILAHAEAVPFAAGQQLVRFGEVDQCFYILSAGTVEVVIPLPGGGERIVRRSARARCSARSHSLTARRAARRSGR